MKLMKAHVLVVFSAFFFIASGINTAQEQNDEKKQLYASVKQLMAEGDRDRAIEFINSFGEPLKVSEIYNNIVMDFYWKDKSLPDVISFAQAGIQFCQTKADEYKDENSELFQGLQKNAKKLAYNLASFCWPGWNEKDVIISAGDIAIGLDAARLNVRLGKEIQAKELPLSADYWMLGAQLLASQEYEEAIRIFNQSKELARTEGDNLSELLAGGYIGIAMIVSGDKEGWKVLDQTTKALAETGSEDAQFFIEQFNTALDVFIK